MDSILVYYQSIRVSKDGKNPNNTADRKMTEQKKILVVLYNTKDKWDLECPILLSVTFFSPTSCLLVLT